jgi:NitT/TauT family transport system substrate-binding protein
MQLHRLALAALLAAATPAAADPPLEVAIGIAPVVPDASTFLAQDEGYLRAAGITLKIETANSAATLVPFLASNRVQVVQGGISLGYFNAVAQGLPIILALDSGSTPINNDLMVRPDLAASIKSVRDLKGKRVAIVAPGSIPVYEVGKVLEKDGLTLKDIDIKYMPFQSMGAAFANQAIDAALEVAPYVDQLVQQGLAKRFLDPDTVIEPRPTSVVVYMVNTDWAAQHKEAAHRLFVAFARAGREYCDAYHHGPNRAAVVDELVRHGIMADRALLDGMAWQARDPDGRFDAASLQDIQEFFHREGLLAKMAPMDRVVDQSYAEAAAAALGPYKPANRDSKLAGCW